MTPRCHTSIGRFARNDVVNTSFLRLDHQTYTLWSCQNQLGVNNFLVGCSKQEGHSICQNSQEARSLLEFCLQRKSLLLRKKLQLTAGTPEKLPLNYLYDSPSPTSWWSLNICQLRRSEYPHLRRTCAWLWEWRSLCNRLFSIGLFSCALWCITIIMQAHRPIW